METTIGSRIALIRGKKSQAQFAKELGVHKNSLGNYERNERTPDAEFLRRVIEAGYSANWLVYGIGEINLDPNYPTVRQQHSEPEVVNEPSSSVAYGDYAYVPKLIDVQVSAGDGSEATDGNGYEELAFRRQWLTDEGLSVRNLRLVTSRGDSMTPTIPEGATLLVDISHNEFLREGIYVIRLDDHLYAKRLQRGPGGALLVISDNPLYKQIIVEPSQQHITIVGKVVWLGHTM